MLAELMCILENVKIIALSTLSKKNIQKAITIVEDIDEDDYPFIALYLQYKHKIWTQDQVLIDSLTKKGYQHFFITTEELGKYLHKKR